MRRLVVAVLPASAGVLAALVLACPAGARSTESVTCSTTAVVLFNFSGSWTSDTAITFALRQKGTCLWWVGRRNVFFGSAFGFTVSGVWADVGTGQSGTLTVSLDPTKTRLYPGSTSATPFAAKMLAVAKHSNSTAARTVTTTPNP
jgi:hypothetical protein